MIGMKIGPLDVGSCALALALGSFGCAGDGFQGEGGVEEGGLESRRMGEGEADVLAAARSLGFAEGSFELADDGIIVGADMEIEAETLRYLAAQLQNRQSAELTEKGYFETPLAVENPGSQRGPAFQVPRATSINLSFASNLPAVWQTAFTQAAAAWNNGCINIQVGAGDDVISVESDTTLEPDVGGIGRFPVVIDPSRDDVDDEIIVPGGRIRINPNNALGVGEAFHIAVHELGHNLGFAHPGDGSHILRTGLAGVPTMMAPVLPSPPLAALTEDDLSSRDSLYRIIERRVPDRSGRGEVVIEACPNGNDIVPFD
jgi:hypothetical protein